LSTGALAATPQLARIADRTYLFAAAGGAAYWSTGRLGECSDPACRCAGWSGSLGLPGVPGFLASRGGPQAITASHYSEGGRDYLVVADCDVFGRVSYRRMSRGSSGLEEWVPAATNRPIEVAPPGSCVGEPELVEYDDPSGVRLLLFFRSPDGSVQMMGLLPGWTWASMGLGVVAQLVHDHTVYLQPISAVAAVTATVDGAGDLYLAYSDPSPDSAGNPTYQIRLLIYQPGSGLWEDRTVPFFGDYPRNSRQKVGFVWQRWPTHEIGRFWLAYHRWSPVRSLEWETPLMVFTDESGTFPFPVAGLGPEPGADPPLSAWPNHTAYGLDLLVDGDKIRGADAGNDGGIPYVRVWQNADGVYPWRIYDFNDWGEIGRQLCLQLTPCGCPGPACTLGGGGLGSASRDPARGTEAAATGTALDDGCEAAVQTRPSEDGTWLPVLPPCESSGGP
jgi:hypothetical protein